MTSWQTCVTYSQKMSWLLFLFTNPIERWIAMNCIHLSNRHPLRSFYHIYILSRCFQPIPSSKIIPPYPICDFSRIQRYNIQMENYSLGKFFIFSCKHLYLIFSDKLSAFVNWRRRNLGEGISKALIMLALGLLLSLCLRGEIANTLWFPQINLNEEVRLPHFSK